MLVGHSYAGNTIPLVAARRPLRHLVFLCAMIPDVGRSLAEQLTDKPEMLNPAYEQGTERARRSAVSAVDRPWHRTRRFLFRLRRADRAGCAGSPSTAVGQSGALSVLTDRTPTSADDVRRVQRRPDAATRMVPSRPFVNGSTPSSSNCPAAIRRCCLRRRSLPTCCSSWRSKRQPWRVAGRRWPAGRCRRPDRGRAR